MHSIRASIRAFIGICIVANISSCHTAKAGEPSSRAPTELSAKMFRKCRSVKTHLEFWVINPENGTLFVASNRTDGSDATLIATLGDTKVYSWQGVYLLTEDNESYTVTISGPEQIDTWFCHPLPITDMEDE